MGKGRRGVASPAPRQARAAAAAAATRAAAGSAAVYDGLHHGMRLLERCVHLRLFHFYTYVACSRSSANNTYIK